MTKSTEVGLRGELQKSQNFWQNCHPLIPHDNPDDLNGTLFRNFGIIDHERIPGTDVRVLANRRDVPAVRRDGEESATGPILESALRKIGGDGDVPLAVLHVPQGRVSEQSRGLA